MKSPWIIPAAMAVFPLLSAAPAPARVVATSIDFTIAAPGGVAAVGLFDFSTGSYQFIDTAQVAGVVRNVKLGKAVYSFDVYDYTLGVITTQNYIVNNQ